MYKGWLVLLQFKEIKNIERNFIEQLITLKRIEELLEEILGEDLKYKIMEDYYYYLLQKAEKW